MLPYQTTPQREDGIAIVGIGGAGANILQCFGGSSAENVRLCSMSLDERVGRASGNVEFIQLGAGLTHGIGSGGDPEVGQRAAQAAQEEFEKILKDKKLLVLVVGLGGGTGSGAAPVLASVARDAGLFLVSVVVMPFAFEGRRRRAQADSALEEISRLSDIVYCFENDYMEELFRNRTGARAVFEEVNRILAKATASVPMLASSPGFINLGLDELAAALENSDSRCLFGSGSGFGPHRAEDAAKAALESPLISYRGALRFVRTMIVHVAGGDTMSLTEIRKAMEALKANMPGEEVNIFFGTTVKPHLGDELRITLIASIDSQEFKDSFQSLEEPSASLGVDQALLQDEGEPEEEDEQKEEEEAMEDAENGSCNEREALQEVELPEPETKEPEVAEDEEDTIFPSEAPLPRLESAPPLRFDETRDMRQGELLPKTDTDEDFLSRDRVRDFFPDDDNMPKPYTREAARRRMKNASEDDLDTPPSLRFNDLRDMFPEN